MNPYKLRCDTILDENGISHTVYGIDCPYAHISIKDVFCIKSEAEEFINKCNTLDLSPLHLQDVIQDLL